MKKSFLLLSLSSALFANSVAVNLSGGVQVLYDCGVRGPIQVKYQAKTKKGKMPRFYNETTLPENCRVSPGDYLRSTDSATEMEHYSRGNLTSHGGKVSMAVVAPMQSDLYKRQWKETLDVERELAEKGSVRVEVEVEYGNTDNFLVKESLSQTKRSSTWSKSKKASYKRFSERLRKKYVLIPSGFKKKISSSDGEICYYFPNENLGKFSASGFREDCDELFSR